MQSGLQTHLVKQMEMHFVAFEAFIDGTVEGTPADLTIYKDSDVTHDRTYYGNGCPNDWGEGGVTGSKTPCTTRIVETVGGEDQKNGTYYPYQAATSGTGGAMSTENSNSPDTFCPLGWQLPYGGTDGDYYDQSKSFRYLFNEYGYGNNQHGINGFASYPLDNVWGGYYTWSTGMLYAQGKVGIYWSTTVVSNENANSLYGTVYALTIDSSYRKDRGRMLRCVNFLASFSRFT